MAKYVRKFTFLTMLLVFLLVPLMSKATGFKKENPIETITLNNVMFKGTPVKIKVPAKYGDFSTNPDFQREAIRSGKVVLFTYVSEKEYTCHQLFMNARCPEPVALRSYFHMDKDLSEWIIEYWLFDGLDPVPATDGIIDDAIIDEKLLKPCKKPLASSV